MIRLLRRLLSIVAFVGVFAWLLAGAIDNELASGGVLTEREQRGIDQSGSGSYAAAPAPDSRSVSACGASSVSTFRPVAMVTRPCAKRLSERVEEVGRQSTTPRGGSWPRQTAIDATRSESLYQGKPVRWWARRAVQARKDANARGLTIRRLKREVARQYAPSFEHYFTVAALTYRVDRAMLERKGRCESVNFTDFYNETPIYNGEHAQGVMGFIPSTFNSTPYRGLNVRYDHLANIMAGAWMHAHGRGGEWVCR